MIRRIEGLFWVTTRLGRIGDIAAGRGGIEKKVVRMLSHEDCIVQSFPRLRYFEAEMKDS